MTELFAAHHNWMHRPDDERFVNLTDMLSHFKSQRASSRALVHSSKRIEARPTEDNRGLVISGGGDHTYAPTNWAFGQLAHLAEAPQGYLRTLPSPIAADCINYGLQFKRSVEDVGLLLYKNGTSELRAATGPNYGRVWNEDVVSALAQRFGDGDNGDWRVPGVFGKRVTIDKENTTLFASDRDMFVFLADEENRVEVPNRRNGQSGTLARGFFVWNSEVGKTTLGIGTFLYDYVCCNRIVWGAQQYQEIRIRHTASAPVKWLDEVQPVLEAYARSSVNPIQDAIVAAQNKKIDDVSEFLAGRFGKKMVASLQTVHMLEEQRPIETLWDVTTAVTAYARGMQHNDARVELEREGGKILDLAAA
jgi:hypothetical protein